MTQLKNWKLLSFTLFISSLFSYNLLAQCGKFEDTDNAENARNLHMFYRTEFKAKKYDTAYPLWKKTYEAAPAADGKRNYHYNDGREILKHLYQKETDERKQKEFAQTVLKLYDEEMECYPNLGGVDKIGFLLGRKAYDMFYTFQSDYPDILKILEKNVAHAGKDVEYIILFPYARIIVDQFRREKIDKEKARATYQQLLEIADHNIDKQPTQAKEFQQAKDAVIAEFRIIEGAVFDCSYFKKEIQAKYDANPDDPENFRAIYIELLSRGCDQSDPLVAEIVEKDKIYVDQKNKEAEEQRRKLKLEHEQEVEEWENNNPRTIAAKLQKTGDYKGAIIQYQKSIDLETDNLAKAKDHYQIANIQFGQFKDYKEAKHHFAEAARLNPTWGKPIMRIGDIYVNAARTCYSDAFNLNMVYLAAVEKYEQAKSIDASIAEEAQAKISKYQKYRPDKAEVHMRPNVNEGESYRLGCIIQETVKVKVK